MTVLIGYEANQPAAQLANGNISLDLSEYAVDYWPIHGSLVPDSAVATRASNLPVETTPRVLPAAHISAGYFEDFYLRLRVDPADINLGNLLSTQSRTVALWNAFLEPITVTDVSVSNGDGITITAPAGFETTPFVLQPLQEIKYTLSVDLDGPPSIDAAVLWTSDHGTASAGVQGSRITLFPFIPDWSAGIDETLSARSSLLRAPSGDEQAVSLRKRYRRSYTIPYVLKNLDAQLFDNLLFGWQSSLFGVPAWPEQDYLTADTDAGSNSVSTPTAGRTIVPNGLVMVFRGKDTSNAEVREVLAVSSSGFTTKTPFSLPWPTGSRVVPVLLAAASPQLQASRLVPTVVQASIQFDCEPSSTDPNMAIVAAPALYRGYELYLGRTNWRDSMTVNVASDVNRIDFQTGVFRLTPQSGFSTIGRSHTWFMKSLADVTAFRQWLQRRLGKTVGVWMPSATDDFTIAKTVANTESFITVKTNGYAALVKQHAARQDIFIRMADGSYFCRRITESKDNGDGTTILNIDSPLGVQATADNVMQFSFLSFYRLSSDDNSIHWHCPGIAEAITGLIPTKAIQ